VRAGDRRRGSASPAARRLLQACLGLEVNGPEAQVDFTGPCLPASLGALRVHNLEAAGAVVDLQLVPPRE
jgi:hypothetical protein